MTYRLLSTVYQNCTIYLVIFALVIYIVMSSVFKAIADAFSHMVDKLKEYYTAGGGLMVIVSAAFSNLTGIQKLMLLLLGAVFVDLVTGIMAYHYEWKKEGKPSVKGYLIQSSKLRQTYAKGASYLLMIGLVYWMSNLIFADVKITMFGILRPLSIVEFFIASIIGIEIWSNLENLKRMNVDIIGKAMEIISKGHEIVKGAKKGEFKKDEKI